MKKKISIITIIVITILGGVSWRLLSQTTFQPITLTIGMEATPVNSLIYIAEDQNYFEANGLKVIIKDDYPSGAAAAEGMLKGEVDITTAAELAIARKAFEKTDILTFGTIDKFMHQYLVGRKDRGIAAPEDLEGKKIGSPLKTGAQFNMDRFFDFNNIDKNKITIVDIQAPKAVDSLMNGDIDAVVAWQPNVSILKERLGNEASVWSVQNNQPTYCALVATNAWIQSHPKAISRLLKSLSQAEDYLTNNNAQAQTIIQKRLNYSDAYIKTIWPEHQFSLALDESLILAMEDQARWLIKNNLTGEKTVPDFLQYVQEKDLKNIKPEAVNIIR